MCHGCVLDSLQELLILHVFGYLILKLKAVLLALAAHILPLALNTLRNNSKTILGPENRTQTFFSETCRASRQNAKKFGFPGFEGHTELFGTHPFTWKTPTPPEDIRTKKCGFGFLFLLGISGM